MSNEWYGINYPFKGGAQNVLSKQVGTRIIQNDLLQLIYTNPGERVYRPTYGIGIRTYLFELNDDQTLEVLQTNIRQQISMYETRVDVDNLSVTQDKDNKKLSMRLVCTLIQSPGEKFEINLNLPILGT